MSIRPLAARDHRIDFLRGFALVTIFINHVPGNVLEPLTSKNFGLSDSAELFVLLAGMAAAFAYFPRFTAGESVLAGARAVKRAGILYLAHIASTVVGLAIVLGGAVAFMEPSLLEDINIPPLLADPVRGFVGLATMGHQIGYHNILPMYVCLLLAMPLIMALAHRRLGLLLAASLGVYALTQVFGLTPPAYPAEGGWFFNPMAWQLIFVVGFLVGARMLRGETPVPFNRWLWLAAAAYLVAACIYHRWNLYGSIPDVPFLPHNFQINEKPWLALPRLLHILSLAYVVGHSPVIRWIGKAGAGNPLVLLGRNALPVFWIGTALSMVGQVGMRVAEPGWPTQIAFFAVGLSIQVAVAFGLDRLAQAEKRRRTAPAAAVPAPTGRQGAHAMTPGGAVPA